MKDRNKMWNNCVIGRGECCRIHNVITLSDFSTSYPNPNRINRIANELNEYLRYKYKNIEV